MYNAKKKRKWRVAILANIKDKNLIHSLDLPLDAYGEFENMETVRLMREIIEADGHETELLLADKSLPRALESYQPDICFNDAGGLRGDAREAQVPAILEMTGIPYTHSRILTNAIALDKTLTKRIWRDHGLPVAHFQEFVTGEESLAPELQFPLFVKPAHEGSGMGIDDNSIVMTESKLRERIKYIITTYNQPALVETFLPGNECTVGQIGGPYARASAAIPNGTTQTVSIKCPCWNWIRLMQPPPAFTVMLPRQNFPARKGRLPISARLR